MEPDYYFVDRLDWEADRRKMPHDAALQDVFELPQAVVRLDRAIKTQLCQLLSSKVSTPLRVVIERSRKELEDHRDVAWSLSFRATYQFAWCHELAWFAIAPPSTPELVTIRTPFKHRCHVCESGGYGYRGPREGFGRKWPGDLLTAPPIPTELQRLVGEVLREVSFLRSSGAFDPIMMRIARAMGRLRRSPNAYIMLPIAKFYTQGKPIAITAGKWLSPATLAGELAPKYYRPCPWCRGSGSEY